MLRKLTNVMREVFWLKPVPDKKGPPSRRVKKTAKKKAVRKSVPKKTAAAPKKPLKAVKPLIDPSLARVGEITHYFDRIKVAVVKITQGTILVGDRLTIAAKNKKPFVQKVWSMQIESRDVKVAKKGQLIGIKVDKPAAPGDAVYK